MFLVKQELGNNSRSTSALNFRSVTSALSTSLINPEILNFQYKRNGSPPPVSSNCKALRYKASPCRCHQSFPNFILVLHRYWTCQLWYMGNNMQVKPIHNTIRHGSHSRWRASVQVLVLKCLVCLLQKLFVHQLLSNRRMEGLLSWLISSIEYSLPLSYWLGGTPRSCALPLKESTQTERMDD